ncbi:two-component regulator propeller domain-containing protein [Candidatus Poribacteria bacterium]
MSIGLVIDRIGGRTSVQKWLLYPLVILLCASVGVWAQDDVPVYELGTEGGEYIKEWLVLGPFSPDDLKIDFLVEMGGEANVDPKEGDSVTTAEGDTLTWEKYESKTDLIHPINAVGYHDDSIVYFFCILKTEVAGSFQFRLGAEDSIAAWVNGKVVFYYYGGYVFDFDQRVFNVELQEGINRCLVKTSRGGGPWVFAVRVFPLERAEISGTLTHKNGAPIGWAYVRLEQEGKIVTTHRSDDSGNYLLGVYPADGVYDLCVTENMQQPWAARGISDFATVEIKRGAWRTGISLSGGERLKLDFTLRDAISIEGNVLMLDGKTPHIGVTIDAIRDGKVVATTLSNEDGIYQFVNLKPGSYQLRCHVLGEHIYYGSGVAGQPLQIKPGKRLQGIDFHLPTFKRGTWRNYSALDGLAGGYIWAIYRDPDGVMWFGTQGGVSRYDGEEFTNLTEKDGLAHNIVRDIHRDPDGVMWFGTQGGVSRYDGKRFVNLTTEDGLAHNLVRSIYRDTAGIMWFGTSGGLSRYDGKEFVNLSSKDGLFYNVVTTVQGASDGSIWIGTGGAGASRYDGKEFTNFTMEDGMVRDTVRSAYVDPDGAAWFGTWTYYRNGGVSKYDGQNIVNLTAEGGLVHSIVYSICRDQDGAMWFGTNGGVTRYNGETFVHFTEADGLISDVVNVVYSGPDGTMWFGTDRGVSRYNGKSLVSFTTADGVINDHILSSYCGPDDVMWFGAFGDGVSRYSDNEFVNFTNKDGLGVGSIFSIYGDPDGVIWFGYANAGGDGGVSRYDRKKITNLRPKDGLLHGRVHDIYRDPDGLMWFGVDTGVSRYDGKSFRNFAAKDGVTSQVTDIERDRDGMMWFVVEGSISKYDGESFSKVSIGDELGASEINTIHVDSDGDIWFGTQGGGTSRYDGNDFVSFTIEDGLAHDIVSVIHEDLDGTMWFGTAAGVSHYDGTVWTTLDTRDGVAGKVNSIHQEANGALWFGTDNGITRYVQNDTPPGVRITSVEIMDELYRDLSAIPSAPVDERVTFEYSAIDLKTLPEKRQYRYRVQAFEKSLSKKEIGSDWSSATKAAKFEWTPRKAGKYTFEVQAIDRDLNYSEPASLEIEILPPPFYTRAGFIIGAILVAFLVPASAFATVLIRQKRQAFEPISNPYIVGNPIRAKEMFFGRESDFEFVRAKLATGQSGLVIVFAGERRSGKTSILFQILEGALGEQFVPVLVDMQAMAVDSDAQFLEQMASEIDEALVSAGCEPGQVDSWESDPVRTFGRFISHSMEQLGSKSLLLMLDEYELMETKMDDGVLRPDLITFFASLLEAHPRLSLIFTGSRHLEGRKREYWSILIGKSLYRRISFLSEQDALRLIMEPVADLVVYPRGIPERIVRLTAGQPFYTQVMCQNMIDRLNEVERNRVRQEDVDAVAEELANNPLPQMIYFWDGLEQDQNDALSLLGEVLDDSNRYASAQMLVSFVQEQKLELEFGLSDLERVLNDLFVNEMLERERAGEGQYEYRFRADLFRLWVRQAHSVWE